MDALAAVDLTMEEGTEIPLPENTNAGYSNRSPVQRWTGGPTALVEVSGDLRPGANDAPCIVEMYTRERAPEFCGRWEKGREFHSAGLHEIGLPPVCDYWFGCVEPDAVQREWTAKLLSL